MSNKQRQEQARKRCGFCRLQRVKSGKHKGQYRLSVVANCTQADVYSILWACEEYPDDALLHNVKESLIKGKLHNIIDELIAAGFTTAGDVNHSIIPDYV